jgi:hypothetical protein
MVFRKCRSTAPQHLLHPFLDHYPADEISQHAHIQSSGKIRGRREFDFYPELSLPVNGAARLKVVSGRGRGFGG